MCSRIRGISEGYLRQEDFEILGARSNPRKSGKIGRKKEFEDGKSCGVQKGGGKGSSASFVLFQCLVFTANNVFF